MGYRDLIDISLNVDASELYEKLETLDGRVKAIEDGGYPVDEDKVHDLIADYVANEDLMDKQEVERAIDDELDNNRDYVTSDDLTAQIEETLSNKGIDDGVSSTVEALEERVTTLENDELSNQVGTLANEVESLTERLERRLDNLQGTLHSQVTRIEALQEQVNTMQDLLGKTLERSQTALTFFDFIKQAFAMLKQS